MFFSIIVPVYNRPDEVKELLHSLTKQTYHSPFEVVIIEDGSTVCCRDVVHLFDKSLSISYHMKPNSGPGDSRNYGMKVAKGDYFLILDSDCILPPNYLMEVESTLKRKSVDCFGGVDDALDTFSPLQKAINFAMTSPLTTGGVRGGSEKLGKFQPRSFNMGISRQAFEATGGFGTIHPGEDPDLSIRLWKLGFKTYLFSNVKVFHKRRISWDKFYVQVNKFGKVRPILDSWHPQYAKATFLLPTLFSLGCIVSLCLLPWICLSFWFALPIGMIALYLVLCGTMAAIQYKSFAIGAMSIKAILIQFWGYGMGYLRAVWKIRIRKEAPQKAFPTLFFEKNIRR